MGKTMPGLTVNWENNSPENRGRRRADIRRILDHLDWTGRDGIEERLAIAFV